MKQYDLHTILHEQLKSDAGDLVTRATGQRLRRSIETLLQGEEDGAVVSLDFSAIGVVDYSCADEVVAKLVSRLLGGEYGDRYLLLGGLTENQRENIEVALERKGLAAAALMRDGSKCLLGTLNNYLRDTLSLVAEKGEITAAELSRLRKVGTNTGGTRLLNLHRKRLVRRSERIKEGGRTWVYQELVQGGQVDG